MLQSNNTLVFHLSGVAMAECHHNMLPLGEIGDMAVIDAGRYYAGIQCPVVLSCLTYLWVLLKDVKGQLSKCK